MTLTETYQHAIRKQGMVDDPVQRQAVEKLQQLIEELTHPDRRQYLRRRFPVLAGVCTFNRWLNFNCLGQPVKGIYFWGSVGRGKTWLVHLFYDSLPFEEKRRLHFHVFMQWIHAQLSEMKKQKNPLKVIAKNFARNYRILCLDEFIVIDITDAMLLNGLLKALVDYGVTLVVTSNRVPDDLYLHGLQRERFLPAIALIKTHTQVFHLDNGVDHRLALPEQKHLYYHPLNAANAQQIHQYFAGLSIGNYTETVTLNILNRPIKIVALADNMVWFEFTEICSSPRAAQDYIEIARQFHTVFISNVVKMDASLDDKARRFIYLIDALYDSNVKLVILAEALPQTLYQGEMLKFAFHRTSSRLIEMRSRHYLQHAHNPQQAG